MIVSLKVNERLTTERIFTDFTNNIRGPWLDSRTSIFPESGTSKL
jgi:hypothetical protein